MLFDLGTNSKSGNSGIPEIPGHFCAISGNWKFPEKHVLQNALRSRYLRNFGENRDIFGHFFRNVTNLQKCKKNAKKRKKKKTSRKHLKFCVFIENRAVAICRSIEKVSKMTPKSVHTLHTFFPPRGAFSGFSDFQLRIEVKFRKRRFRRFLEKISLLRLPAGGRRPHLHGAKI
jgi:hypothetical protein